jgi:hypothetical protein
MPCERIRVQLTSYLDGDLDADDGTVVRGHLRTCEACRQVAADEAVLRDGLRALPSVDPPSAMWAAVQARLAQEEVAEAERPAWRRAFTRWGRFFVPSGPRVAAGGLVVAAAIALLWVKMQRVDEGTAPNVTAIPPPIIKPERGEPAKPTTPDCQTADAASDDVTADLAAEPARVTACYSQTIAELLVASTEVRSGWSDDRKAAFDGKIQTMRDAIAKAPEGKPQQRASRALIRYLEGAVIREDVLLASRGDR